VSFIRTCCLLPVPCPRPHPRPRPVSPVRAIPIPAAAFSDALS